MTNDFIYIEDFGDLYIAVQKKKIFPDQKIFVDAEPLFAVDEIMKAWNEQKIKEDFDLKRFVIDHFRLPEMVKPEEKQEKETDIEAYIEKLWDVLTKRTSEAISTLIHLPEQFVVPGGRFGEIFYWDSYFTMLGLQEHKRFNLIESMVANFAFLIDNFGFIPNGNRSYFLSRSQPPFFPLMVNLLCEINENNKALLQYLPQLEKEYAFWMKGKDELLNSGKLAIHHMVKLPGGELLHRYFDEKNIARPEGYAIDTRIAGGAENASEIYKHIRAACESGWDFSSRWFADRKNIETIEAADIIPVDLNCLMVYFEQTLAKAYQLQGKTDAGEAFAIQAKKRITAINRYLWNEKSQFFDDYNFKKQQPNDQLTAAALFPLFFEIADHEQGRIMADKFRDELFKEGGMLTTLNYTDQQWDAPNGWAPLQWIAFKELHNYGFIKEANNLRHKWMTNVKNNFAQSGTLKEKYNVEQSGTDATHGEYITQEGFGWTNGVYIKMKYSS